MRRNSTKAGAATQVRGKVAGEGHADYHVATRGPVPSGLRSDDAPPGLTCPGVGR